MDQEGMSVPTQRTREITVFVSNPNAGLEVESPAEVPGQLSGRAGAGVDPIPVALLTAQESTWCALGAGKRVGWTERTFSDLIPMIYMVGKMGHSER